MGTIEEIIKTIDDELIDSNKDYLLLGHANNLLANKEIISISEKSEQLLKKILEENKISHAYQTDTKPKQWRIPLSDEGKIRNESTIKNKIPKEQNQNNVPGFKLTQSEWNWIVGIILLVVFIFAVNLCDDDSPTSSSLYIVNTTTYAATSKSNFEEMFQYIRERDEQALSLLMLYGNVQTLSSGTEVYLVSSHFSYCIVHQKGSTQNLWVVTEHITQK